MVPRTSPAISPNGSTAGASSISGAHRYHPQTQGKIERWHQTLKNRVLLENYYLPGALEAEVGAFVEHYHHARYHESLHNLTPADVYFGRGQTILHKREGSNDRRSPIAACSTTPRRLTSKPDEPEPPLLKPAPCLKLYDDGHSSFPRAAGSARFASWKYSLTSSGK